MAKGLALLPLAPESVCFLLPEAAFLVSFSALWRRQSVPRSSVLRFPLPLLWPDFSYPVGSWVEGSISRGKE